MKNSPENYLGDLSDQRLLRRWTEGDQRAAELLVDRYAIRLVALVASRMNARYQASVDPQDVVQSALGSFFSAVKQSRLQISGSLSLWHLLATFARRKMMRTIERQDAAKRGGGQRRVSLESVEAALTKEFAPRVELSIKTPDINALLESLEAELSQTQRELLYRLVSGQSQNEIAQSLSIDQRTVRRRIVKLRETLTGKQTASRSTGSGEFTSAKLPEISYREIVLGKLIGAGGFGKVYRASLQGDRSLVAVKFLRKAFWHHHAAKQSFLREIEAASQVRHRGVVRYLGWGQSPHGGPYVISQWIDGQTLEQWGQVAPQRFVHCLRQICDTLHVVHRAGVVHGDLSPSNVLIDRHDRIVLTDFGFSRVRRDHSRCPADESVDHQADYPATDEPGLGGTLGFAAPEQIAPAFGEIGPKTDFYALGGLAFWYLAKQAPHHADSIAQSIADTLSAEDVNTQDLESTVPSIKRLAQITLRKSLCDRPSDLVEWMSHP